MKNKKFGDRRDAKKVRGLDGLHMMMCDLKPERGMAEVYMNFKVDVTELVKYFEKLKKTEKDLTYFHLFSTAIAKVIYNKPLLNRYVIDRDYYDRNEVTLSFVAKQDFTENAIETVNVVPIGKNDNLHNVEEKIAKIVNNVRSSKNNSTDDLIDKVGRLPKHIRIFLMYIFKKLDKHDLLPASVIKNDVYHSTIILSNLGSIGCGSIYHNLTNFGTNSIIMTMGKVSDETVIDSNGKVKVRKVCDFGINLDERIADGFYFVNALKMFDYILNNPILLEDKVSEKVEEK